MKACPFCAEQIQDAAVVCRFCQRQLPGAPVTIDASLEERKAKARSTQRWVLGIVFGGIALIWIAAALTPKPTSGALISTPSEPCSVEAGSPSAREAGDSWCKEGTFTRVNISDDDRNYVVMLQFSRDGMNAWKDDRRTVLTRFEVITDRIAGENPLNIAFSLFDTNGQLIGGCKRGRRDRATTCR